MKIESCGRVIQMEDSAGFPVAVKRWDKRDENADKARWEQEMLSLLQGKGIPKFIRNFEDADYFYVVTEWISGITLKAYVEESGGFISSSDAISVGTQLLAVVERMHKAKGGPYIHTDLNPTNIMLKGKDVYVTDLESLRCKAQEKIFTDEKTVVMGSRPFTAPEVFSGIITPESDYYAIGSLLYYMTTGETWKGDSSLLEGDQFGNCVKKLLDVNPEKRKQGLRLLKKQHMPNERERDIVIRPAASVVGEKKTALATKTKSGSCVVYIDNNLRFASELAYIAASKMNLKVGLFAVRQEDIAPAAKALGIRNIDFPETERFYEAGEEEDFYRESDISEWFDRGFLMQPEGFGKLHMGLITSSQLSCDLEYDREGKLLCEWAKGQFDLTVIIGGRGMCYTAIHCDRIISPVSANLWETEQTKKSIEWFCDEYFSGDAGYVAWDYKEGISLPRNRFASIVGCDAFLGEIYCDGSRYIAENYGYTPYCYMMAEIIKEQYKAILKKIINLNGEDLFDENIQV